MALGIAVPRFTLFVCFCDYVGKCPTRYIFSCPLENREQVETKEGPDLF